jgi:hypothetical protein
MAAAVALAAAAARQRAGAGRCDGLGALRDMQALADWLERRPQLGRAFARGQPGLLGTSFETAHQVDVIEFLWASLALFENDPAPDTANVYRPPLAELYDVTAPRERILRGLA